MPENRVASEDTGQNSRNPSQSIGSLVLGVFVGIFTGLIAMALAILTFGVLRLFFPNSAFELAGMNATAVIFIIFFALGWVGGAIVIRQKLPHSYPE
jgi:hypothetical protein